MTGSSRALLLAALLVLSCARKPTESWQAVEVPTDADFNGICFIDSLNGWVTGGGYLIDGGIVGRTRDGGRSWRFETGALAGGGASFSLNHVQFLDSLRGFAVGGSGIVLATEDGGDHWRPIRYGRSTGDALFDIQFLDARNAWASGPASVIRSQDGGATWGPLVTSTSENGYLSANAVHFVDTMRGWIVGHGGTLMRSEDGGVTWTPVALPLRAGDRPTLWDVAFSDRAHGWVVGDRGSIFHTEDGGGTWVLQDKGVPVVRVIPKGEPPRPREPVPELETEPDRLTVFAVQFLDANQGWAVGYYADVAESVILGTRDGGATWSVERVQPGELLRSLCALDSRHAWAAGDRARTARQVILRYAGEAG